MTALDTATEALDRLHTTAESHDRVMILEVMGRHAGWIALHSGVSGGADVILIPEIPFSVEQVARKIRQRDDCGSEFTIIVAAEGAKEIEGHEVYLDKGDRQGAPRLGGIGHHLAAGVVGEDGEGGALRRPRPPPARREPQRLRPHARHQLRLGCGACARARQARRDGRACTPPTSVPCRSKRPSPTSRPSRPRASSSAPPATSASPSARPTRTPTTTRKAATSEGEAVGC